MARLIDADALLTAYEGAMKELVQATNAENISLEALSLLCGAKLIAEAPTIGGWISVKDGTPKRPPDVGGLRVRREWYLVALESGTVMSLSYEFDEDRWQGVGSPVTHWMPLPEPPKEVSGGD